MKTVENKVIAGVVANIVVMVVAWIATRWGLDLSPDLSAQVSGAAAVVGSSVAGYLVKHTPRSAEVLEQALTVLAENGQIAGVAGSAAGAAIPDGPTDVRPEEDGEEVPEPSPDYPSDEVPEDTEA